MFNRRLRTPLLAAMVAALATGAALAQSQTPAGTQVSNQASATYTDSNGGQGVATSGMAIVVVQQVYAAQVKPDNSNAPSGTSNFTLSADPSNTKSGVAGSTANFAYTLSNTGNGNDNYNLSVAQASGAADNFDFTAAGVAIYQDLNGNGLYDSGEPAITGPVQVAAGGTYKVVVVAPVPSSGVTSGNIAKLDLVAQSFGGALITASPVGPIDNNNIAQLTVINDANLTLSKTASGPDSSGVIIYQLSGSNSGSQPAKSATPATTVDGVAIDGVLISDPIPAGTTLVISPAPAGSAGGIGATTVIYKVAGAWTATASAAATEVGLIIRDGNPTNGVSENALAVAANYSLTFRVTVGGSVAGGSTVSNTGFIKYNPQTGASVTNPSNKADVVVPSSNNNKIGPNAQPVGVASGTYTLNGLTITRSGDGGLATPTDKQDTDSATPANVVAAGSTVTFQNTVRNTGNVSDNITVTVDPTSTLTGGYTVQLFQTDGVTPLSGAINLASGGDYTMVVKVNIPGNAAVGSTATAVLKSTSQNDSTKTDTTSNIVKVTKAAAVVLGNSTPTLGADTTAVNKSVNPGTPAVYPMDVVNNGGNGDSFNLTGSVTVPLVGGGSSVVAVVYYPASADTNSDGVLSAAEIAAASPISNTGLIAAGAEKKVFAVVNVPATAAANTGLVLSQSATSPTTGASSSFNNDTLAVNTVSSLTLSPIGSGTTIAGGTLIYQHTLTNNGNGSASVTLAPGTGLAGFTYLIYRDVNGNGGVDAGDTVLYNGVSTAVSVGAGQSIPILVQVTTLSNLTKDTTDVRDITATDGTSSATVKDTTKIVAGDLQLTKTATLVSDPTADGKVEPRTYLSANGLPVNRSEIVYTITAKNIGSAPITNVVILDPLPSAYVDFKNAVTATFTTAAVDVVCPAGLTCTVSYSNDNGLTWTHTPAAGYVSTVTNIRITVTGGPLNPSDQVVIKFVVSVR